MATLDQLTSIANTTLSNDEIAQLEAALERPIPKDMAKFLKDFGYASFIDIGFGEIPIGTSRAAFGQFYAKRPGTTYDPWDFASGALRVGDAKSHFPSHSLIFAGDELGGEYFINLGADKPVICWMIYGKVADYVEICSTFTKFLELIEVQPYND